MGKTLKKLGIGCLALLGLGGVAAVSVTLDNEKQAEQHTSRYGTLLEPRYAIKTKLVVGDDDSLMDSAIKKFRRAEDVFNPSADEISTFLRNLSHLESTREKYPATVEDAKVQIDLLETTSYPDAHRLLANRLGIAAFDSDQDLGFLENREVDFLDDSEVYLQFSRLAEETEKQKADFDVEEEAKWAFEKLTEQKFVPNCD